MKTRDVEFFIPDHTPLAIQHYDLLTLATPTGEACVMVWGTLVGAEITYMVFINPRTFHVARAAVKFPGSRGGFVGIATTALPGNAVDLAQTIVVNAMFDREKA